MSEDAYPFKTGPDTVSERKIRPGGLFRCCIQTAYDYDGPEVPGETVIDCACTASSTPREKPALRLAEDGIWEWNR